MRIRFGTGIRHRPGVFGPAPGHRTKRLRYGTGNRLRPGMADDSGPAPGQLRIAVWDYNNLLKKSVFVYSMTRKYY